MTDSISHNLYIKKELKKTRENSYLKSLFSLFLTESAITYEQLGTAFQNYTDTFHSYIETK